MVFSEKDEIADWSKYQKLVLHELKRLNNNIEKIGDAQKIIDKDLEVIKVKAAFMGGLAGVVILIFDSIVNWVKS